MSRAGWIVAASVLPALVVVFGLGLLGARQAFAQDVVNFGVDPEITGNSASTLGTIEYCYEVTCPSAECGWDGSSSFDGVSDYIIDIVVTGDTEAPLAYDASLNYDPSIVHIAAPDTDTLIKMPGSLDLSEALPGTDGVHAFGALYLMGDPGTAGDGTLVRVGLDIGAAGYVGLSLRGPPLTAYASRMGTHPVTHPVTLGTSMLAINNDCPIGPQVGSGGLLRGGGRAGWPILLLGAGVALAFGAFLTLRSGGDCCGKRTSQG